MVLQMITGRGWESYNRNILTFSQIRATIIESHKFNEMNDNVFLSRTSSVSNITNELPISNNLFSSINEHSNWSIINQNTGLATLVTDIII